MLRILIGVLGGGTAFAVASFISLWTQHGLPDPVVAALIVFVLAFVIAMIGATEPRIGFVMAGTMLLLMIVGALLGSPSYASGVATLDPGVLLKHGGRSVVLGAVTGALGAVSTVGAFRQRRRSESH